MTKYTEYIENNIMYAHFPKGDDDITMEMFCEEYKAEVNKTKICTILLDTTDSEVPSSSAKRILFKYLKELRPQHPEDRVACLVKNKFWQMVAWSVATVTGHTHIKIYSSKKKALEWLRRE